MLLQILDKEKRSGSKILNVNNPRILFLITQLIYDTTTVPLDTPFLVSSGDVTPG